MHRRQIWLIHREKHYSDLLRNSSDERNWGHEIFLDLSHINVIYANERDPLKFSIEKMCIVDRIFKVMRKFARLLFEFSLKFQHRRTAAR